MSIKYHFKHWSLWTPPIDTCGHITHQGLLGEANVNSMFVVWSLRLHLGICWELYVSFCFPLTLFIFYEEILHNGNTSQLPLGLIPEDVFREQRKSLWLYSLYDCVLRNKMTKIKVKREKRGREKYFTYIIIWIFKEIFKHKNIRESKSNLKQYQISKNHRCF